MRRKKADFYDLVDNGIMYHNFYKVKNKEGLTGVRYELSNPLTQRQRERLGRFKNIIISQGIHRYAPEIKQTSIIILDRCIKAV